MEGLNATPLVKRAVNSESSQVPHQGTGLDDSQKDVSWEPQSQGCRSGEETSRSLSAHGTSVPVEIGRVGEMLVPSLSLNLGGLKQVTHPARNLRLKDPPNITTQWLYQVPGTGRPCTEPNAAFSRAPYTLPAIQAQDRLTARDTAILSRDPKRQSLEPNSLGSNPTTAAYQLSDLQFPHL